MSIFDIFKKQSYNKNSSKNNSDKLDKKNNKVFVGAADDGADGTKQFQSFDLSNISQNGDLSGFDYKSILRDKQNNIDKLYMLADYYADADEIIYGIIKHVYLPYSTCSDYYLTGASPKTKKIYEQKYIEINLKEKIDSIMYQYWKYANVVIYYDKGGIYTLPIHKCKIGNVMVNGEPVVDYNCISILNEFKAKGYAVKENWIKDNKIETYFKGYPSEVVNALNAGSQYAQLNPDNTFVMQAPKEDWQRYSIPFIAACLTALSKKELISSYEDSLLNIGMRPVVHAKYGDKIKGMDILPGRQELAEVQKIFKKAMNGFPLVVTNHLVDASILQADTSDLFQWEKYNTVNSSILSAGGISGILVTGASEDGSTFATAQVSMNTAAIRIESARKEFCRLMNKINKRILKDLIKENRYNIKEVPNFKFVPMDIEGTKSLKKDCEALWEKGIVSTETLLDTYGYSKEREKGLKEKEINDNTVDVMIPQSDMLNKQREANNNSDVKEIGRPELDSSDRNSDQESAERGKLPKPSNPEGSNTE